MRKVTALLLGAAFLVAAMSGTARAKSAGIGLEWGVVPVIQFGDFDMKFNDEFTLAWDVSDRFEVGVFRGDGNYRAETTYTNDTNPLAVIDQSLVVNGTTAITGIRLLTVLPMLSFVKAGIEAGTLTMSAGTYSFPNSDGSTGVLADFGAPVAPLQTLEMYGLVVKATPLQAKTKTVTTEVNVGLALRIVDMPDTNVLGTQEVNTVKLVKDGIDAVTNYSNLAITIGLGIVF
jgi:hypothetical protein